MGCCLGIIIAIDALEWIICGIRQHRYFCYTLAWTSISSMENDHDILVISAEDAWLLLASPLARKFSRRWERINIAF